jgi:hypothetical protein
MGRVEKGECWEPWRVLAESPVIPTRKNLNAPLFVGSRFGGSGDAREIFQGDGHGNQCVAVAINSEVASRIVAAANVCSLDVFDIAVQSLTVGAPGLSPVMRDAVARSIAMKVKRAVEQAVRDAGREYDPNVAPCDDSEFGCPP